MCSCNRDGKPHTEACRASHRRWDRRHTAERAARDLARQLRRLGVK